MGIKSSKRCEKKVPYQEDEAARVIEVMAKRSRHFSSYKCPHCELWHLTSLKEDDVIYAPKHVLDAAGIKI